MKRKVGIIVVVFDPDKNKAIAEAEVEIEAPRFPLVEANRFRSACLEAFIKAGGENLHQ